ncbi:activator-dependent family glycosyltransferase [Actinosynnema sp. NPDC047251]|uniref:Glycosyltransferase, family 1 n=1 Tax=Saccharothrix espanaensis (strain ATCC 51144 / DSM 44229 / JCM 9112 / NBRC 15066 / NRRL 15764) TaxID=1179773 RepID=K0K4B9_SACES|nr:activator-dependent family glycosyltransferase [Saccharothrix espanaensis]CCH33136.1 Glycosyltransferase, family 1 [Saccharothrix espanaensis DSM 44229]
MRVLFTTYPEKTIFLAMVPLAWALRTAGHEVRFACHPTFADVVTQAGLTAVPVGRGHGGWRRMVDLDPEGTEEGRAGMPSPYDTAALGPEHHDYDTMKAGYDYVLNAWHRLDNFPIAAGLVEFAQAWKPDLVVWEPNTYAGPIAAKACGAAHARLLWSIDVFGVARQNYLRLHADQPAENRADPLGDWLGSYGRKYGFEFSEDMVTGEFTIDQLPGSLRMEADLHYLPMRYVPYNGRAAAPRWLWEPRDRPRVALTLGTTATERFGGYSFSTRETLDALADLDVEVVATLAESEQRKLGRVPDNARLVSYVPLNELVPTCAAVINHAGPGTFLTTALHAVPQLTVPWDFDEPELARRAGEQGAALVLDAERATGSAVRDGVRRLLAEPGFRERADALRAEIHALPSPNELVTALEELAVR